MTSKASTVKTLVHEEVAVTEAMEAIDIIGLTLKQSL